MNIIAVDDEQHALRTIARVIKSEMPDIEPVLFNKSDDALDYAHNIALADKRIDVAFLDINMGGMNGLMLAKHLKDINGKTNIVFVTGYSEYAMDAHDLFPAGYLLKPVTEENLHRVMENLRHPVMSSEDKGLRVQCFGNFEVFLDGRPLRFPRAKSKEVFACLVHKKGASCTIRELAAMMEENTEGNVQKYIYDLKKTLEEAGHGSVVNKQWGSAAVDTAQFDCDLYRFYKSDAEAVNAYSGEYMAQYSWAEFTVGYLDDKAQQPAADN